jgi:hypothetical protein
MRLYLVALMESWLMAVDDVEMYTGKLKLHSGVNW